MYALAFCFADIVNHGETVSAEEGVRFSIPTRVGVQFHVLDLATLAGGYLRSHAVPEGVLRALRGRVR